MRTLLGWMLIAPPMIAGAGLEAEELEDVPSRVLFVGNSYTGGIKAAVTELFQVSPHRGIEFGFIHPGGVTLQRHLANAKTMAEIAEGKWDVVVLQEQSQTPAYPGHREKFLGAAKALDAEIRRSGAETVFYQTWGRRDGDRANGGKDFSEMQDLLTEGYGMAARGTGSAIAPVGESWRAVWSADPELARSLYRPDGSHPSARGAYLAACVFYRILTGDDPGGVDFDAGLPKDVVEFLRDAANGTTGGAVPEERGR